MRVDPANNLSNGRFFLLCKEMLLVHGRERLVISDPFSASFLFFDTNFRNYDKLCCFIEKITRSGSNSTLERVLLRFAATRIHRMFVLDDHMIGAMCNGHCYYDLIKRKAFLPGVKG